MTLRKTTATDYSDTRIHAPSRRQYLRAVANAGIVAVGALLGIQSSFRTASSPRQIAYTAEVGSFGYSPDKKPAQYASSGRPPSYLVFIDPNDNLVKAKNGLDGSIDFADSAATPVLQNAVNSLSSYTSGAGPVVKRGTIFIDTGNYVINGLQIPGDYIEIAGVALRTRIILTDSISIGPRTVTDTQVKISNLTLEPQGNFPAIRTNVISSQLAPVVVLRDLCLEQGGTDPSVYAVRLTNNDTHNSELTNVYVNGSQSGILIEGTHTSIQTGNITFRNVHVIVPPNGVGLELRNSILNTIVGLYVGGGNAGTTGILLNAASNDTVENKFYNIDIEGVDTCIRGTTSAGFGVGHNDFFGGFLYPNPSGYGIRLSGLSVRNSFYAIKIDRTNAKSIQEDGSDMLNYYERCRITGTIVLSASSRAEYVMGYCTKDYGSALFSGDGATKTFRIAHGLFSKPVSYYAQPGSEDAAGMAYVTADQTNLIVSFSKPPPSGSNNVALRWRAEM